MARKSHSGAGLCYAGALLGCISKVQTSTAVSVTEAELIALSDIGKKILFIRHILTELAMLKDGPTPLYEDNKAVEFISENDHPTERTRHVDIRYFAIQEWAANGWIKVKHLAGIVNPADAFTKALDWLLQNRHVQRFMGYFPPWQGWTTSAPPPASPSSK